jgi:hypothetical protein
MSVGKTAMNPIKILNTEKAPFNQKLLKVSTKVKCSEQTIWKKKLFVTV